MTQRFSELGVPVIDADVAARVVVARGTTGLSRIEQRFGPKILQPNGALNRAALRSLIFGDPALRKELEGMLHPLIREHMERQAKDVVFPYLVMAIPLLIESGSPRNRVDRILVVDADEAAQMRRLLERDGSTMEQARAILASQTSRESRLAVADDVLVNDGSVTDLRQAVDRQHQRYLSQANLP